MSYLQNALKTPKTLSEPVVAYRIHDYGTTLERNGSDAFALCVSGTCGKDTEVTMFGFNGSQSDGKTFKYDFFLPFGGGWNSYTGDRYLIVRGSDISNVTLCGYKNGLCAPGEEVPEIYGEVERIETTYGALMPKLIITQIGIDGNCRGAYASYQKGILTEDAIYRAVMNHLCEYGEFADEPIERYDGWGGLDFQIEDAVICDRIMYVQCEVTIPAGGSVNVTAKHKRRMVINVDNDTGAADYRLEMFPTLGSTLSFTSQSVKLRTPENVIITEQSENITHGTELYYVNFKTE